MGIRLISDLDATLVEHMRNGPISARRLAELVGHHRITVTRYLQAMDRRGLVHCTGKTATEKRWHLGPRADFDPRIADRGDDAAPEGWSTPRSAKAGHRQSPKEENRPDASDSWWTKQSREGFTAAAQQEQARMTAPGAETGYIGNALDAHRDRWSPGCKARGED